MNGIAAILINFIAASYVINLPMVSLDLSKVMRLGLYH